MHILAWCVNQTVCEVRFMRNGKFLWSFSIAVVSISIFLFLLTHVPQDVWLPTTTLRLFLTSKNSRQTIGFSPTSLCKEMEFFNLYEWQFSAACLDTLVLNFMWQRTISMSNAAWFMMFSPFYNFILYENHG